MGNTALVLFSGGQDSATCLAWALERFDQVETIGFDYKQRHRIELDIRQEFITGVRALNSAWNQRLGVDHLIDLSVLGDISSTALTDSRKIEFSTSGLPNTFVPGRNLLFFTMASAVAYRRDLKHLVGGMCETDFSGYPDCRDDTLKSLQVSLNLGMDSRFVIETPLMWLDKSQTWQLAQGIGGAKLVDLMIRDTHTCYLGDRSALHEWGFGCGDCPACGLRREGYQKYLGAKQL